MTMLTEIPHNVQMDSKQNLEKRDLSYRALIFALTYLSYACYHLCRKVPSIVKNVLCQNCSGLIPPSYIIINEDNKDNWCDWIVLDNYNADTVFGFLDFAFLLTYAIAMFGSGFIAERMNLRYFLSFGMLMSALFTYLFGLGYNYNIHSFGYYLVIQIFSGLFQTTGWPGVVTCLGNWFGRSRRGLIFGMWNSNTSLGNILGALLAGIWVDQHWGLSFIVPAAIMGITSIIIFTFLIFDPQVVNCSLPDHQGKNGVLEFSMCLFFTKLVTYTFLFWLPRYIKLSTPFTAEHSAYLSTLFDVGGILGGIIAGYLSDHSGMNASICGIMLLISIPMLLVYQWYGHASIVICITLLIIVGLFVNGPYALITTAVSTELGTHKSLTGDAKALATVTAIIDGTGSLGAAIGPLLAGLIVKTGWSNIFLMLILSNLFALLLLLRLVRNELKTALSGKRKKTCE